MRNELSRRIATYKDGISVLMTMEMAADRKPILERCIAKLSELEAAMENIVDVSSADALEYAKQIVNELSSFANVVAQHMHNNSTPERIEKATALANKWASTLKQPKKAGFFSSRKTVDIEPVRFHDEEYLSSDMLTQIAQSKEYIENVTNFQSNISDYKAQVKSRYDNTATEERLAESTAELERIQAEKADLRRRYESGELSVEEVGERGEDLMEELDDVNDSIDELKEKIRDNKETWKYYNDVFVQLDDLMTVVEGYRNSDPAMVAFIGEYIDFNSLYHLMHGDATPEDADSVRALEQVQHVIEAAAKRTLAEFRDARRKERAARIDERRAERERRRSEAKDGRALDPAEAERKKKAAAWILGEAAAPKAEEKKEEEKTSIFPSSPEFNGLD